MSKPSARDTPPSAERFRKKPVVIEAFQFNDRTQSWPVGWPVEHWHYSGEQLVIPTLEGSMCADIGDWIIKGIKGEFYPCKPDIFYATYENA